MTRFTTTLAPPASDPYATLLHDLHSIHATILAMLSSLARPDALIATLTSLQRTMNRHPPSSHPPSTPNRWLGALLEDTRKSIQGDSAERIRKSRAEARAVGSELRYARQVLAGELASWWDLHGRLGRRAIKGFVKNMVVRERERLEGMRRGVRGVREGGLGNEGRG